MQVSDNNPLLVNDGKTDFDPSSDEEYKDGLGSLRVQHASNLGPARGKLVDPDKAAEDWAKMPVTIGFGCCLCKTTQKAKMRIYFALLVLILSISIGTGMVANGFVARIGQGALNAKTSIDNAFSWVQFIETLLIAGLTARIASSRANGQLDELRQRIVAGLIAALAYGVLAGVALLFLRRPLLSLANLTSDEESAGEGYYIAKALFLPFSYAVYACNGIIFGLYDLPIFVLIVGSSAALQLVGTYLLIYVFGFGLLSDAIMNGANSVTVTGVCLVYLSSSRFARKNGFSLTTKPRGAPFVSREVISSFGIDNIHLFIYDITASSSAMLLVPLAARISPNAETATSVLNQLSSIPLGMASGFTLGINMVGSIFVARRAYHRLRTQLKSNVLIMGVSFLLLAAAVLIWPRQTTEILLGNNEPAEIFDDLKYPFFLLAVSLPALAVLATFEGAMYATLRFRTLSMTGIVGTLLILIPLTVAGVLKKSLFLLVSAGVGFILFRAIVFCAIYFFVIWPKQRADRDQILARISRRSSVRSSIGASKHLAV